MTLYLRIFAFGCFFLIPGIIHAQIIINEIAWMGTTTSANAEWIELYNTTTADMDITGWKLIAQDGAPNITLKGIISAESYFLLERTSDATVPNVTADQIYTGVLGNEGEVLFLKNLDDETIDTVNAQGKWPAGDNTTKETMQKNESGDWITAPETPKAFNAQTGTVIVDDVYDQETGSQNDSNEQSSGTSSKPKSVIIQEEVIPIKPDPVFTATMKFPEFSTRGVPVPFSVIVKENGNRNMVSGKFEWSMGDGKNYTWFKNTDFDHTFHYPGDYVVVMTYYSSRLKEEPDSVHKKKITIVDHAITIINITDDGGIVLENTTDKEIDLFGWTLHQGWYRYMFPRYTVVPKKKTLTLSPMVTGILGNNGVEIILRSPHFKLIDTFPKPVMREPAPSEPVIFEELAPDDFVDTANIPAQEPPSTKKDLYYFWQNYQWYIVAGGFILLIVLAYLLFDLYATRHNGSDEDLE